MFLRQNFLDQISFDRNFFWTKTFFGLISFLTKFYGNEIGPKNQVYQNQSIKPNQTKPTQANSQTKLTRINIPNQTFLSQRSKETRSQHQD